MYWQTKNWRNSNGEPCPLVLSRAELTGLLEAAPELETRERGQLLTAIGRPRQRGEPPRMITWIWNGEPIEWREIIKPEDASEVLDELAEAQQRDARLRGLSTPIGGLFP